jgi:hypothetical protein
MFTLLLVKCSGQTRMRVDEFIYKLYNQQND